MESIKKAYDEYNFIIDQYQHLIVETRETDSLISFNLKPLNTLEDYRKISTEITYFEINCNPYSDPISDIIINIENGIYTIESVNSIKLVFQKAQISEFDAIFFDYGSLNTLFKKTNVKFENKLMIGLMSIEDIIETELAVFYPIIKKNSLVEIKIKTDILQKINFYISVNKKTKHNFFYNPFMYLVDTKNLEGIKDTKFIDFLNYNFYLRFLEFVSEKDANDEFLIRGEKSVHIKKKYTHNFDNNLFLEKILNFLISENKFTEKYLIIKNVLTLYLSDYDDINQFDKKLQRVWKTINHYYNHYLESDIKDFFKTKDQLLKEAMNLSKVVYEQTDKINTSIIASLFSFLILFATSLIKSLSEITEQYLLFLSIAYLVFSIIFYLLLSSSSHSRYQLSKKQFEYFMEEVAVLQNSEIVKIKRTYIEEPYNILEVTLSRLLLILTVSNSLFIGIVIGYFLKFK